MRRIGIDERRARLGVRHHLAAAAADPVEAARGVVALHSTDPASVFLSVHARTAPVEVEEIERALYDERSLVRMLGMRRTMFVVPVELAPVVQASCTKAIAVLQRRTYTKLLGEAGVGDGAWLKELEEAAALALAARGEATGAQLSTDEPRLRTQVMMAEREVVRRQAEHHHLGAVHAGRRRAHRAGPAQRLLDQQPVPVVAGRRLAARGVARPARRGGPGRAGAPVARVVRPGHGRRHQVVDGLDGRAREAGTRRGRLRSRWTSAAPTGLVLPDDLDPVAAPEPWVALLPALDPTPMGWAERSWYIGEHSPRSSTARATSGPTVWSDGRIVGGWAQRGDGESSTGCSRTSAAPRPRRSRRPPVA